MTFWTVFVLPAFQVENDSAISANPYIFFMLTECNCLLKYRCPRLPAKYYLFLKQGITCSANNCKDLVSGKSGNHTVKYVTPICKYLFISLMIVSGVPAVTRLESFHILFLHNIFVFLLSNSPSSAPRNKIPCHALIMSS